MPRLSPATVGVLMAAFAALMWSTSGLLIKVVTLDGFVLSGLRSGIAGLVLLPFLRPRHLEWNANLLMVMGAYGFTMVGFVFATRWTAAANAIALQSTAPAWVFVISLAVYGRVRLVLALPILLILAGMAAFLAEPVVGSSREGNLMALLTGVSFALTQLGFSRLRGPAVSVVCLCNLLTAAVCLLLAPQGFRPGTVSPAEWTAMVYLGCGQMALGFFLFTAALRRIEVGQASILAVLEPLFNPLWVFLAIGEIPSAYGMAGWVLVLAGIVADTLLRRRLAVLPGPKGVRPPQA